MSGRLIGPKSWDRNVNFFGVILDSPRAVWAACGVIYAINSVLVCMRPEIAMEIRVHNVEPRFDE